MMTLMLIMVSRILAPRAREIADKFTTYECGERPVGPAWILFNFRFYAVALAFIIFDIEMVLVFPCVVVFQKWLHAGDIIVTQIKIMRNIYHRMPSRGALGAVFTRVDQVLNWCRLSSVWYLLFGLDC